MVSNSSKENELVVDLFMGSATTGIACMNLKRDFIGIEKDIDIYKLAKKRVEKVNKKLKL